jgi:hypothetical protein
MNENTGAEIWQKEPAPIPNDSPASWDLVLKDLETIPITHQMREAKSLLIADIHLRDEFGTKKYGVRLQPNNGRNSTKDAYEEALDCTVYLRNEIEEKLSNKIVTRERESVLRYLTQMYLSQLAIALGLRYVLLLEKEINERSITNAGDSGNTEESGEHQSNIVIPKG